MLAAASLAACENGGSLGPAGAGVAEVSQETAQQSQANIASLTDVIQRNPSSAEAYNTRGVAYARIAQYDAAIADFTQAIKLNPNDASAALTNRALADRQT